METQLKERRILVVDDEPVLARMASRMAASFGWTATTACDPSGAHAALAHGRFDLVLSDIGLGTEDGVAFARALKRRAPKLPVVLMSGDPVNLVRAKAAGLHDTIAKPFDREALQAAFARALGRVDGG